MKKHFFIVMSCIILSTLCTAMDIVPSVMDRIPNEIMIHSVMPQLFPSFSLAQTCHKFYDLHTEENIYKGLVNNPPINDATLMKLLKYFSHKDNQPYVQGVLKKTTEKQRLCLNHLITRHPKGGNQLSFNELMALFKDIRLPKNNPINIDDYDKDGNYRTFLVTNNFITDSKKISFLSYVSMINTINDHGCPALYYAIQNGYIYLTEFLLLKGADVNATNANGHLSLHTAIMNNQVEIVKLLLLHNADINATNANGKNALQYAVLCDRKDIIPLLISKTL